MCTTDKAFLADSLVQFCLIKMKRDGAVLMNEGVFSIGRILGIEGEGIPDMLLYVYHLSAVNATTKQK